METGRFTMRHHALKLNRLSLNKRGDLPIPGYKLIMWMPSFFFTIIVIAMTFYVIFSFIITATDVSQAESKILAAAAYYSEKGLSVTDAETGRVYTGLIDESKFTSSQLEALFKQDRPLLVGRFVKKQQAIDYMLKPEADTAIYTDETRYKLWQPIAQAEGEGEGSKTPYPGVSYVATSDGSGAVVETVFIASG